MALNTSRILLNAMAALVFISAVVSIVTIYMGAVSVAEPVQTLAFIKCARHEDGAAQSDAPCIIWQPSFLQLLARPELFDGRLVDVVGFVHFEFEGDGIHLHQEDSERHRDWNGVGLRRPVEFRNGEVLYMGPDIGACQDRYARVVGRFHAEGFGHMGMSRGGIYELSLCEAISDSEAI